MFHVSEWRMKEIFGDEEEVDVIREQVWWWRREWQCRILFVEWGTVCIMCCFQHEKEKIFITYLTCKCLIYHIYVVLRDDKDSEEQRFIREKKFIVGERAIKDLISKIRCEKCGEDIIPSSITEGEKISSGVKYTYLCNVSCFRPLSSTRNTL